MANVVQPLNLGFNFGLSAWQTGPSTSASFHHFSSPSRAQKRRHEVDENADNGRYSRDETMDISVDRPKRPPPKRARVVDEAFKDDKNGKERHADNDVDVGVLLASLPTESLLPLLTSLLNAQPSLKPVILQLIPRPSLETAIHALASSAKKLTDAYPYSNTSFDTNSGPTMAFNANGGMRESYVVSRLRTHIADFVSACLSYLPYFSFIPSTDTQAQQSSIHKDRPNPSETFLFLSALTRHIFGQPSLTQASLSPLLLPRLSKEWMAWLERVDVIVNAEGGIFGYETANGWIQGLDGFANAKESPFAEMMQAVRNAWLEKVGWLVGRTR